MRNSRPTILFSAWFSTLFMPGVAMLLAQTNVAIGTTPVQASVKPFGINLGTPNFYDSGQMMKNLVSRNPGFEGEIFQSTIRCARGTASSCVDDNAYSGWPAGFWNGATVEFFFGAANGRKDTVSAYTASTGSSGGVFTLGGSGTTPAQGDYLIVRKKFPGNSTAGWWPSTGGAGSVTDNSSDLPPNTSGLQTVALKAPGANDSASLAAYFDTTQGHSFVALNGTYQLTFKAKGTGGANVINLRLERYSIPAYLSQIVNLTPTWATYMFTFNASETGAVAASVGLTFATKGQDSFLLDDVSLLQINSDPTNPTAFRDPVVNALRTLSPGTLRYWAYQLGDTLDNLIAGQFGRQRSGYSAWSTHQDDISHGLPEFLQLCETLGADPWIVVPTTFTTAEAANLIEFLSGSSATPYGAKRAALGHSAPWTSSFAKIHLELGNEAWNGTFKGGTIEYSAPYGQRAQAIFGAMRSNAAFIPSAFDLVLGGQANWPGRNQDIQNNCNNNDSFAIAPYLMFTVDTYSDNESLYGPTFAEPEAFNTLTGTSEGVANGLMLQNLQLLRASNHPVPVTVYETNLSTVNGAISQPVLNSYGASLGTGLAVVDSMLQNLRQGVGIQNMFALSQYQFLRSDGKTVPLWGAVIDMGVTDRRRPQYLALQLANQAIGSNATMLQTVHSGADPTWDQPLLNTVQLKGAHYLQSFAFSSGTQRSLIVFNLHRTSSLPITFMGANAPVGTVTLRQLTSGSPADNNENSSLVQSVTRTLTSFNASSAMSLPPVSMTVLTWTGGGTPAPVISSILVNPAGTSATITWNTDQPSNSQVLYGTTSNLGSTSSLNTALIAAHSVQLTGLTPGTAYWYSVTSTNSQGLTATSAAATFSTSSTGPVLSSVSSSAITNASAKISWITDRPSSSQVSYGTGGTGAYSNSTPLDSALVTSHSVILTGLTANTTYNFSVKSATSAGTTSSANYSFTTPASGPLTITSVSATGISTTGATITWTTDKASTSQIIFGTTTAYGSYSAYYSAAVTSHSVTLTALVPGTTYNFEVGSVGPTGTAISPNYTFKTLSAQPSISSVSSTAITSTSATITWITDVAMTSQVLYGTDLLYRSYSTFGATPVTWHAVTLTGLAPGTTYNFVVTSVGAGGTLTSSNYTLSTLGGVPVIGSIQATAITRTSATITWTTDKAATSQVVFGTTPAYGRYSSFDPLQVTVHSITLTNLTPGTQYNFQVASVNSGGTALSSNQTFATTP